MNRKSLLTLLLLGASATAGAQINSPGSLGDLTRAEAMYSDKNYIGCLDQLRAIKPDMLTVEQRELATWLTCRAQARVNPEIAKTYILFFLDEFGASTLRGEACMLLGDLCLEQDPAQALQYYDKVEPKSLSKEQKADLDYHRGYALLKIGLTDRAEQLMQAARQSANWRPQATFYLGYIAYLRHDYAQARSLFQSADPTKAPGNLAPYYLAQIDYVEGNFDQALSQARGLLSRGNVDPQYRAEANRIAGESLFQQGHTSQALPYLREYAAQATHPERSTLYILGTAEFDEGNYSRAIEYLEPVTADQADAMAQSAYLFIGQALMEDGQKDAAILAFDKATKMDFDPEVQEAAFYNYAVAKFSGARVPFGSSAATFEEFLRRYPSGRYAQNVQEYLVAGYLTDQNFEAALASINRMKNPGPKVIEAKRKVLYALGTRALAANKPQDALSYLKEADLLPGRQDAATAAQIALSFGEALYRTGDYSGAVVQINKYLRNAPKGDVNIPLARYDLGYARFALKDYKDAAIDFQNFVDNPGQLGDQAVADALNRLGDTQFYTRQFDKALEDYGRAYRLIPSQGDYPLFQQAVIEGYQRDNKAKVATVKRLLSEFPSSSLVPDALLEMTEGYIQLGDNESALATYRRLVDEYPTTEQGRRGYLQMALTQLNAGDRAGALESYKEVVKLYPTSEEARMAVDELKRLAADDGTLGQLSSWLAGVDNAPRLDVSETDQLAFDAAEKLWLTKGSTQRIEQYLIDYPQGANRAQAIAYMMDNAQKNGNTSDALTFASEIVDKYPDSRLAESALAVKATAEHSLGRGGDALRSWTALERRASSPAVLNTARVGIMRVSRDLGDQQRVIDAADALLASSTLGSEDRREAQFSRALALDLSGKTGEARESWQALASNTDDLYGAKSAYYLAQSYFDSKDMADAQSQVEALIDSGTPHTYWLARGFILLSDIYAADNKKFEAREYLNSLRENYPGQETDIFQMIDSRLDNLK